MYHELEAAFAAGYTLSGWQQETAQNKARVIAHHMHKNMREGYQAEQATANVNDKGKGGAKDGGESYRSLMRSMGL